MSIERLAAMIARASARATARPLAGPAPVPDAPGAVGTAALQAEVAEAREPPPALRRRAEPARAATHPASLPPSPPAPATPSASAMAPHRLAGVAPSPAAPAGRLLDGPAPRRPEIEQRVAAADPPMPPQPASTRPVAPASGRRPPAGSRAPLEARGERQLAERPAPAVLLPVLPHGSAVVVRDRPPDPGRPIPSPEAGGQRTGVAATAPLVQPIAARDDPGASDACERTAPPASPPEPAITIGTVEVVISPPQRPASAPRPAPDRGFARYAAMRAARDRAWQG